MFNVGGAEILVVCVVALLVLGPEQLPKAMRTLGTVVREVRKISSGFQDEMRSVMDSVDPTGSSTGSGTGREKPRSPTPPSGAPSDPPPPAPVDGPVTEVAARNPGVDEHAPSPNGAGRRAVDPADRAAG